MSCAENDAHGIEKLLLKNSSKLNKFLHSEVNILIQHVIVQDQEEQNNITHLPQTFRLTLEFILSNEGIKFGISPIIYSILSYSVIVYRVPGGLPLRFDQLFRVLFVRMLYHPLMYYLSIDFRLQTD